MKRLLSTGCMLFLMFLLLLFYAAAAETDAALSPDTLSATVNTQTIRAAVKDETVCFFLPSNANLHNITLQFPETEGVTYRIRPSNAELHSGAAIDVVSNGVFHDDTGMYELTVTIGQEETALFFMQTQNIGAMYISIENPAYGLAWLHQNKENDAGKYSAITMHMDSAAGDEVYDDALTQIKGRGNSTWLENKRPYQIKLSKKTDLLASGNKDNKSKTWILLANALDKTLFKNAFAFDMARAFGLQETPEYTYVNVYINGEYRGVYMLTEKVQINSGRVDIFDLEEHNTVTDETAAAQDTNRLNLTYQYNPTAVCDPDTDITGGYLLELDSAFYRTENCWFKLSDGSTVVVKSPECATKAQMDFISVYFNEMVSACSNNSCNGKSVSDYIDLNSLSALYMINEYTMNIDFATSSTYFFLPEEGNKTYAHKFYAGPAWDFDTSFGNRRDADDWIHDPTLILFYNRALFKGSVIREEIAKKAKTINALQSTIFSPTPAETNAFYSLSYYKDQLSSAQRMNFSLWPFDLTTPNTFGYPTYEENYDYAYNYLQTRHTAILPRIISAGSAQSGSSLCPYCHKEHKGVWGKIVAFFHKIFYRLKKLS